MRQQLVLAILALAVAGNAAAGDALDAAIGGGLGGAAGALIGNELGGRDGAIIGGALGGAAGAAIAVDNDRKKVVRRETVVIHEHRHHRVPPGHAKRKHRRDD